MANERTPLVSVCVTFYNSEQFVGRMIESCLSQTYRNVQIVFVDDASTDKSGEIIQAYAAKDLRVKYYRTSEKLGITKSLQKVFEIADGEYVTWLGADDWPARDAIENGVKSFLEHPDASAVMPRVVSLRELGHGKFEFISDNSLPTGEYDIDWIARQTYRTLQAAPCLFALFRREDALRTMEYFFPNYCYNPAFPEELRKIILMKIYAPDFVFFLEILSRYKKCVSNESFIIVKIAHTSNLEFKDVNRNDTAAGVLKTEYYRLIFFGPVYSQKYPNYYRAMKIYTRTHALSEVLIHFVRSGLRPGFFNVKADREMAAKLLEELSTPETVAASILAIPRFIYRFGIFLARRSARKIWAGKDRMAPLYGERLFLHADSGFRA